MVRVFLIYSLFLLSFNALACPSYLQRYEKECQLHDEYARLKESYFKNHGLNIEFMTGYRAQRLIDKKVWEEEADRIRCRPEKAYLPSPEVWMNWEKGAVHMNNLLIDEKMRGDSMNLSRELFQEINLNAVNIKVMSGFSAVIKGARPGKIREPNDFAPSFKFFCYSHDVTEDDVKVLENYDLLDDSGSPLISYSALGSVGSVVDCPVTNTVNGHIFYTDSQNVESELNKLLAFADEKYNEFMKGEGSSDYSPLDFIADFQRWFVAIHPFGDGNGRTSRFLQDYLLSKFGLPLAPGGRIQNDVLMEKGAYQDLFTTEMERTVAMLKGCEEEINALGISNPESLSCDCRPMYQGEYIPESLDFSVPGKCDESRAIGEEVREENIELLFGLIYHLQNVNNLN